MTGLEFVEFHAQIVDKMNKTVALKNTDYAGADNTDAFANFKMVEKMGICTTEQGFLARMTDKMMRVTNIINSGKTAVKSESVNDTLLDLANYAILLVVYLEAKGCKNGP